MRVLGVIPARYHSTRLPGKPLMDICGKTMIHRVYDTLPKTPLSLTEEIEELKVTENGYPLKVIKTRFPYTPPNVNTLEDLEQVRRLVKEYGLD